MVQQIQQAIQSANVDNTKVEQKPTCDKQFEKLLQETKQEKEKIATVKDAKTPTKQKTIASNATKITDALLTKNIKEVKDNASLEIEENASNLIEVKAHTKTKGKAKATKGIKTKLERNTLKNKVKTSLKDTQDSSDVVAKNAINFIENKSEDLPKKADIANEDCLATITIDIKENTQDIANFVAQNDTEFFQETKDNLAQMLEDSNDNAGVIKVNDYRSVKQKIQDAIAQGEETPLPKDDNILAKNAITKVATKQVVSVQNKSETLPLNSMQLAPNSLQNVAIPNENSSYSTSDFQTMVNNQILENVPEFVKAGTLVLKDNNIGTINIVMHPESLGDVKVRLELSDKIIAGNITVASKEAWQAFKENIPTLQSAFEHSGFESAAFNLSFTGGGSNPNFSQENREQQGIMVAKGQHEYSGLTARDDIQIADFAEYDGKSLNIVA